MWRSVIALVLIPSLSSAQTIAGSTPQGTEPAQQPTPPYYRAYTNYERIRPGSDEKAAFSFNLNPGAVPSHRSSGGGIVPLRLELKGDIGLSVTDIDYPMGYDRSFQFRRGTINVLGGTICIQFKVKAARDVKPGAHVIHGQLIFQQVSDSGLIHPELIEVELPVEVGRQGQMIVASDWPFSESGKKQASDTREKWTLVALAPLLIPLFFIASIVCMISGEDCRC